MKQTVVVAVGCCVLFAAGNAHALSFRFATSSMGSIHDCPVEAPGCSAAGGDVFADFDMGDGEAEPDLEYTKGSVAFRVYSDSGSLMMADLSPTEGGHGALFLDSSGDPTSTAPEQNDPMAPNFNPDNAVFNQSLFYEFNQEVTMYTLMNYNSDHGSSFTSGADYTLIVDGVDQFAIEAAHMVDLMAMGITATGTRFEFRAIEGGEGFYVSSFNVAPAIPEPATALLLGLGLAGLGAVRPRAS